jgi:protein SCO1/2
MKIQTLLIGLVVLSVLGYFGYKAHSQFNNEKPERELLYFGPVKKEQDSTVLYHSVADFNFIDQDSNQVTNANFEGKIYVTDFFFSTCPSICKEMATLMLEVRFSRSGRCEMHNIMLAKADA